MFAGTVYALVVVLILTAATIIARRLLAVGRELIVEAFGIEI